MFISFDCLNLTVLTVKRAWNGFHFSVIFRSWVLSIVPHFTYRVQHCFQVFHNLLSKSGLQSSRQSDWLWKHWNCHRSLKLVANFLLCQSQDGKVKFLQKLFSEKLKLKNSCVNFSIVRFYYNFLLLYRQSPLFATVSFWNKSNLRSTIFLLL